MNRTTACLVFVVLLLVGYLAFDRAQTRERERLTIQKVERLANAVERLASNVEALLAQVQRSNGMEPGYLYHEHYSAGTPPIQRTVSTRRLDGESVEDWKARHAERVADLLAEFPPV